MTDEQRALLPGLVLSCVSLLLSLIALVLALVCQ